MIFTYMWALDSQSDWDYVNNLESLFKSRGAEVYFIELEADYDLRIERNKIENRLLNKPSKRDIEKSEQIFKKIEDKYRLNSYDGEIAKENYIKINNTSMEPAEVAQIIKERYKL